MIWLYICLGYPLVGVLVSRAYYIHCLRVVARSKRQIKIRNWHDNRSLASMDYYYNRSKSPFQPKGYAAMLVPFWPIFTVVFLCTYGVSWTGSNVIMPTVKWLYSDPKVKSLTKKREKLHVG